MSIFCNLRKNLGGGRGLSCCSHRFATVIFKCLFINFCTQSFVCCTQNESIPGTLRNSDGGPIKYSGTDVND